MPQPRLDAAAPRSSKTLRSGERSLAEVLDLAETDDVVAHAKVIDVLKALPRVGAVRATKVMKGSTSPLTAGCVGWVSTRPQR